MAMKCPPAVWVVSEWRTKLQKRSLQCFFFVSLFFVNVLISVGCCQIYSQLWLQHVHKLARAWSEWRAFWLCRCGWGATMRCGLPWFKSHSWCKQCMQARDCQHTFSRSITPRLTAWEAMHASRFTNTNRLLQQTCFVSTVLHFFPSQTFVKVCTCPGSGLPQYMLLHIGAYVCRTLFAPTLHNPTKLVIVCVNTLYNCVEQGLYSS